MYWLRNCTKTENYQWKELGLNPVAPFPYKPWAKGTGKIDFDRLHREFKHDPTEDDPPDYLDEVMGYLMSSKELSIPKTREMMSSTFEDICKRDRIREGSPSGSFGERMKGFNRLFIRVVNLK